MTAAANAALSEFDQAISVLRYAGSSLDHLHLDTAVELIHNSGIDLVLAFIEEKMYFLTDQFVLAIKADRLSNDNN